MKEWFMDLHMTKNFDGTFTEPTEEEYKERQKVLTDKLCELGIVKDRNEAMFIADNDKDRGHPDFIKGLVDEGPSYRFKMEDFWLKGEQERAQRIFKYMHPLIFLPEKLPSFIKI